MLRAEVRATGVAVECYVCGHRRKAWRLGDLAERIHHVLQANYSVVPASPYEGYGYDTDGDEPASAITEMAGLDDETISREIQSILSDRYGGPARHHDGDEDPYGDGVAYAFNEPDTFDLRYDWSAFCNQLKTQSRIFNTAARITLDNLFGNLAELNAGNNMPVIRTYPSRSGGTRFYRGRVATGMPQLEKILADPVREMSAPPHAFARVGRMNGAGISLFYGALDVETCLAEIRAPVGSHVVMTAFRNIRPLKLLDLARLRSISVGGSMFADDFRDKYEFAEFLGHLVKELSRPVMPGTEEMDYLPTQAVAEYLANREDFGLDGMLFPSSQIEDGALNVVLFHAASRTKGKGIPPGSKTSMLEPGKGEDGEIDDVTVWVHPRRPKRRTKPKQRHPLDFVMFEDVPDPIAAARDDWREDTLKWVPGSLEVYAIKGVTYAKDRHPVRRYVEPKRKHNLF